MQNFSICSVQSRCRSNCLTGYIGQNNRAISNFRRGIDGAQSARLMARKNFPFLRFNRGAEPNYCGFLFCFSLFFRAYFNTFSIFTQFSQLSEIVQDAQNYQNFGNSRKFQNSQNLEILKNAIFMYIQHEFDRTFFLCR